MSTSPSTTGVASKKSYVLAILVILFFWQVAAWFLPSFLMPDVHVALVRLWQELGSGEFYQGLGNSMGRLGAGYGAALVAGVVLGLVVALSTPCAAHSRRPSSSCSRSPRSPGCRCS